MLFIRLPITAMLACSLILLASPSFSESRFNQAETLASSLGVVDQGSEKTQSSNDLRGPVKRR